ncbi:MAG: hypothetical protein K2W93_03125 [Burkholderiaceae bacterium]|nr:hypothetical protein [Burkholderiaceae bacterium]
MKLLFLDFDGVLHPSGGAPGTCLPFEWLPTLVELLEPAPDVFLAVHSSWREVHAMEYLRDFLGPLGNRLVGAVPSGSKSNAILAFLGEHQEVWDYLILDDSPAEFSSELRARLLVCSPLLGIQDSEIQLALKAWLDLSGGHDFADCHARC